MIVCKFVLPTGGVCNFENADDAEWCGNCGEKLEWYGEKVVQTEPEHLAVVADEEPRPGGLVERVKSALNIGGDEESRGRVTTGVEEAPVVIPEESPPSQGRVDTAGGRDIATDASSVQQTDVPAEASLRAKPSADQPQATVPTEEKAVAKPVVKRPKPPKPKPGDLICGACGLSNDPTRNFCSRCGTSLKEAKSVRAPWWRRVFHRRGRSLPVDDTTGSTARPKAARAPRPRVKNFLAKFVMLALFGAVIAGFAVPSLRSTAIGWYESARGVLFPQFDEVHPMSASASSKVGKCDDGGNGLNFEKDHCPFDAFDGVTDSFWAESASDVGLHQTLTANFQNPFDLAKIRIVIGTKEDFNTFARPSELRVTLWNKFDKPIKFESSGEKVWSLRWELDDTSDVQEVSLAAQDVSRATFEILHVKRGSQLDQQTSIQNIWFLKPG